MNKKWMATVAVTLMLGLVAFSAPLTAQDAQSEDPVQAKFNQEWDALDPEMRAAVEKMIKVSGAKKQMENMFQAIIPQIDKMIEQKEMELGKSDPRIREIAIRHVERFSEVMVENFDEWMRPMMVAYSRHYTLEEIRELIAFYESPTGRKLLETMPKLMADTMEGMMPLMMKHMETLNSELKKEMDVLIEEIAAEGGGRSAAGRYSSSSEAQAVGAMRLIVVCAITYQTGHPNKGYPSEMADMGPDGDNCIEYGTGVSEGYHFGYVPTDPVGTLNTGFEVIGVPDQFGPGTERSFFADASGVIRFTTENRAATENDPPL